jgi:hypothetical protein
MPEIILDGSPQDSARTWALTHFPNDENSRKLHSFLVALDKLVFSAKKEDLITVTTEGTVWRMLLHWPNLQNLAKAADESYKSGILAGIMLAAIYLMYVFYLPEPISRKPFPMCEP